jgi:4-hydroxy-3-methylbut-2-enyl diphosphate reductase IspH
MHEGTNPVILSGFWVAPQARSICQKHQIDHLVMDTTCMVMNRYHTAVLIAVSHNVGLPVAISRGPRQSFEL